MSVQLLSHIQLFVTPWTAAHQASLSITNCPSLRKLTFIAWVMPSNHIILCRPLLLPSILPSIRVFSNESVLHIRWPKYQSFSLSISPSNEYSGLIYFRIDWLELLAVQDWRVFSNTTVQKHRFFGAQLSLQFNSHPYMTIGKTVSLTTQTFVGKIVSAFDMLSRLVIAFLPRSQASFNYSHIDLERDFLGRTGSHDDGS